jgi:hypothetical protein
LTELPRSFGPRQVLAEELAGVEGIERAHLSGSRAARYAGEAGVGDRLLFRARKPRPA